jgi:hypothetical protein
MASVGLRDFRPISAMSAVVRSLLWAGTEVTWFRNVAI